MNIYQIGIDQDGFGLSAVVVAPGVKEAIDALDQDSAYQAVLHVTQIGTACADYRWTEIICRESL